MTNLKVGHVGDYHKSLSENMVEDGTVDPPPQSRFGQACALVYSHWVGNHGRDQKLRGDEANPPDHLLGANGF